VLSHLEFFSTGIFLKLKLKRVCGYICVTHDTDDFICYASVCYLEKLQIRLGDLITSGAVSAESDQSLPEGKKAQKQLSGRDWSDCVAVQVKI
jgi:hypothetical protein